MSFITNILGLEKKIGVVAPAKHFDDRIVREFEKKCAERGVSTVIGKNRKSRYGYLAGNDQERAEAFMDIWLNEDVDLVWCYTGGYGCTRILPYLDFNAMRESPKKLLGMSDVTALHLAIQKEIGCVSYLGPLIYSYTAKDVGLQMPNSIDISKKEWLVKGKAKGKLIGGNLALICSLMGTPWEIEPEDCVLLLEDVNEEPYRIDRMLSQLKNAGKLENLAGVILASFTKCDGEHPQASLSLSQIFTDYFGNVSYPVLIGFESGHIQDQVILPLGEVVEIDARSNKFSFNARKQTALLPS